MADASEAMDTPATADGAAEADELEQMLNRIAQLAERLSRATLREAADRIRSLAGEHGLIEEEMADSPVQPAQLSFSNVAGVLQLALTDADGSADDRESCLLAEANPVSGVPGGSERRRAAAPAARAPE